MHCIMQIDTGQNGEYERLQAGDQNFKAGQQHSYCKRRNRAGNALTLQALGGAVGVEVEIVQPVRHDAGPISSTRIRVTS